jgi:hypothetical protein
MRCTQAETLISLFVGDDLPARDAAAVRDHIESCARCQQLAAEFTASQTWLREFSAPHFDEAVFDDLRGAVLGEINAPRPSRIEFWKPRWNPRFAMLAASLLLIVGLGIYAWRQQSKPRIETFAGDGDNKPSQREEPPQPAPMQYRERERPAPGLLAHSSKRKSLTRPAPRLKQPDAIANLTQPPPNTDVAANNTTANQEMLRIEMQTADPNIRIIWFAPKTDTSNSTNTK